MIPLILGVIAATLVARRLPAYDSVVGGVAWWTVVIGSSFIIVNLTDRIARRFLPLAALLDMSLVFPEAAPSRVKVAMRTWTTAQLKTQIEEARERGIDDDPTRAGETVLMLVAALNAHDRVTRGHAERTRAYADVLAEELDVPETEREKLRWVALLHDVGKLKVADEILNKDGELDEDEWEKIKRHPQLGDELIAPIRGFLGSWADTILHHHERYDGTGYPQRLVGEEIAYGARIVAVVDAFDAMTSRRSYQPPVPARTALRELGDNAGSQFDPAIVRAFLSISASRLRRLMGPLTVLAQVPFVAGFQRAAEWAGTLATGSVAVVAAVATGIVGPVSAVQLPEPPVAVVTTTVPTTTTPAVAAPVTTTTHSPTGGTTLPTITTTTTTSTTVAPTTAAPTTAPPTTTTTTTTTTTPPPNSPPVAASDAASGKAISVFQIKVLANDNDPDGDILTIVGYDAVSALGGSVACTEMCRYEGPEGWSTPDTFTYTVSDGNGGTATATVTVTPL
ncbi:MAG: HD domain-containing phosphohydrolase [Actinomycetota bacterium]|nr:HD domain-containing phosphohydrolase [Actinomycetota bacterium]